MTVTELLPIVVSVGTAAATAYVWVARLSSERPRLRTHLVALEEVRGASGGTETVWGAVVQCRLAVVNLSTLPNVVLAVRAAVRMADGTWRDTVTEFPGGAAEFNAPPQQAVFLPVALIVPSLDRTAIPDDRWSAMSWRQALEHYTGGDLVLRVRVTALDDRTFTDTLTVPRPAAA